MAKIVLNDLQSGYNLSKINDNFGRISDALNNDVLWRDNPVGEDNALITDIDANNMRIYNLPDPELDGEPVTKGYFDEQIGNAGEAAQEAQQFAQEAEEHANDAEASADSAAATAANVAQIVENIAPGIYVFNGDGVTTGFTINTFPPSEDYVAVYVGGDRKPPSAFTIASNVITITPAPPVGTENVIIEVSATVAAVIDTVEDWGLITEDPEAADDYGSIV